MLTDTALVSFARLPLDCPEEDALQQFVRGGLPPGERASLAAHIESCHSCEEVVAELARAERSELGTQTIQASHAGPPGDSEEEPALPRGSLVDRYVILELLGRGGMGVVYRAFDPALDRKVALKLLRKDPKVGMGSEGSARLIREAKAMARLAHPNVISVYDAGTVDNRVFLAMELVDGETLKAWLETKRSWREVLAMFRYAGRGLAAAHAAGLIHRDFKPENVLVGKDGRVRVTDFGLARATDRELSEITAPRGRPLPAGELEVTLTRTGAMMGTPAYMAPEMFAGEPVTAAADQFSFCVALYRGLFGERPFAGSTFEELEEEIRQGRVRSHRVTVVPIWLQRAVLKGLKPHPHERHESMSQLLRVLDAGPRRRVVALATVGCLLALGVPFAINRVLTDRERRACAASGRAVDGVWGERTKQEIHGAFTATGKPYADAAWTELERVLDGYAQGWAAMQEDACLAARVRGTESTEALERRTACLGERLEAARALVALFSKPDERVVENAVRVVHGLPSLTPCASGARGVSRVAPPSAAAAPGVGAARAGLLSARALLETARYKEGLTLADRAVQEGHALGYAPLEAEALELQGELLERLARFDAAQASLESAARVADSSGADEVRARALVRLILTGLREGQAESGLKLAQDAKAAINRMGGSDELEALRLGNLGKVVRSAGRLSEAEGLYRQALAVDRRLWGDGNPTVADALNSLGVVLADQGSFDEALRVHQDALALRDRLLGSRHPAVAESAMNVGMVLRQLRRFPEAISQGRRAVELDESSLGPDHPYLAIALANLGVTLIASGDLAAARAPLERALEIRERALGLTHPTVAMTLKDLGDLASREGDAAGARERYRRALEIDQARYGASDPRVVDTRKKLAALTAP